jgi:hypothetical protein
MKKIYEGLIGIGGALLLIAFFMDTTVSTRFGDVHNLGLISKQQNFIFLGGILLIAGVITFSVHKNKQTPDEKAQEEAKDKAEQEKIDQTFAKIEKTVVDKRAAVAGTFSSWFAPRSDWFLARLLLPIFIGISLGFLLGIIFHPIAALILTIFFLWMALRPIPAAKALKGLLLTTAIFHGLFALLFREGFYFYFLAVTITSGIGYWICRKSLKQSHEVKANG